MHQQGATDYILKDRPTTLGRVVREISDRVKKRRHRAEPKLKTA